MNSISTKQILRLCSVAVLGAALSGCGIFKVRDIQSDFQAAVALDNQAASRGNIAVPGGGEADGKYREVLDALDYNPVESDREKRETAALEKIADMREDFRPTAYMMLGVSCWRLHDVICMDFVTRRNGEQGLAAKLAETHPRDQIMLELLNPLKIDAELANAFRKLEEPLTLEAYETNYRKAFLVAYQQFEAVYHQAKANPRLPSEMPGYITFQQMRSLRNWRNISGSVARGANPVAAFRQLKQEMTQDLGGRTATSMMKDVLLPRVKGEDPLRPVMESILKAMP